MDATGLWSDEFYTVGKSFQPSYRFLNDPASLEEGRLLLPGHHHRYGALLPSSFQRGESLGRGALAGDAEFFLSELPQSHCRDTPPAAAGLGRPSSG